MNPLDQQMINASRRALAATGGQGASSVLAPPATHSLTRRRKLHVGHFAFMRCVVQGLDLRDSWERYFRIEGELTDRRTVRATIQWIRDEFAAAARREARPGTARLVLIDVSRIGDRSSQLPTLAAFAAARSLDDFAQSDQLEAYRPSTARPANRWNGAPA